MDTGKKTHSLRIPKTENNGIYYICKVNSENSRRPKLWWDCPFIPSKDRKLTVRYSRPGYGRRHKILLIFQFQTHWKYWPYFHRQPHYIEILSIFHFTPNIQFPQNNLINIPIYFVGFIFFLFFLLSDMSENRNWSSYVRFILNSSFQTWRLWSTRPESSRPLIFCVCLRYLFSVKIQSLFLSALLPPCLFCNCFWMRFNLLTSINKDRSITKLLIWWRVTLKGDSHKSSFYVIFSSGSIPRYVTKKTRSFQINFQQNVRMPS